jgi:hypothetical protein
MMRKTMLALLLLGAAAAPAAAQETDAQTGRSPSELYARGYAGATTAGQPADPAAQAGVAALNNDAAAASGAQVEMNAATRRQYEIDQQNYMNALLRRDAALDRSDARYVRQQAAYADAMAAWRLQVAACQKGKRKVCNLPTPRPADYY